ncbi:ABC transporter ATP-binding protein [Caviibacter abscessus]|uniref:ABC transporter ATP-binding protein n=2 Tax=Caviibacter abscessus TaxID=1766719 RepID=UPI00082CAF35|nr:ABC transporter ATP-binding protein [Caviibacter abscessus]
MIKLEASNVSHSFDNKKIIEDINIKINKNEIVSILGPSGCGKTTLFNIVAGLLKADSANIYLYNDNMIKEEITNKCAKVSYMLQKDLLLPFKTVYDNISLAQIIKGEKQDKVLEYVKDFGLDGLLEKYPKALSGGQKQRAALLRTYMFSKEVVLLDEPFSALDSITKTTMYKWFLDLKNKLNLTCLIITHDIDEAIYLSDKIYIINGNPGKIVKVIELNREHKDMFSIEAMKLKKEILNNLNIQ